MGIVRIHSADTERARRVSQALCHLQGCTASLGNGMEGTYSADTQMNIHVQTVVSGKKQDHSKKLQ